MAVDDLKRMPGHLIRRAHQISVALFSEELTGFELTPVQFMALVAVSELPGVDATRLADLIYFDKATIGGVVARLERKGLIQRRQSRKDQRVKVLQVTPAGQALIEACHRHVEQVQDRLLEPLSPADRETFLRLLGQLVEN
jgi:DNA-binding MarR family transcriptional regulator